MWSQNSLFWTTLYINCLKLFKGMMLVFAAFFSKRVVIAWNGLPTDVDFITLNAFKRTIGSIDFSPYLKRY